MSEMKFAELGVVSTHFEETQNHSSADFGWTATKGNQSVDYQVRSITDLKRARSLGMPYPTENVTYVFSTENNGGEPCKLIWTEIDKYSILHYKVQIVPGEDFEVTLSVDALPPEDLKKLVVGATMYVKMEFDD